MDERLCIIIGLVVLVLVGLVLLPFQFKRRCAKCRRWFTVSVRWFTIGLSNKRPATKIYECARCGARYEELS